MGVKRLKIVTRASSKIAYSKLKQLLHVRNDIDSKYALEKKFIDAFVALTAQINHRSFERYLSKCIRRFIFSLDKETMTTFVKLILNADKSLIALGLIYSNMEPNYSMEKLLVQQEIKSFHEEIIQKYLQEYIQTKDREPDWILEKISKLLLSKIVDKDNFKTIILPACQKAVLRSPETSIQRVALTLIGLELDLTNFGMELGKMFATSLHSQDEVCRENAIFASSVLSGKINQASGLKDLLSWYFSVLGGAEGKLTVATHKISILKAIGEMSNCIEDNSIANFVQDNCVKGLETEIHEGTLSEYINVMTLWCSKLGSSFPSSVLTYIPKGLLNLKSPVKTSFCCYLVKLFNVSRINHLSRVKDVIQKSFEKLSSQHLQGSNLLDSIALGALLLNSGNIAILNSCKTLIGHVDRKIVDASSGNCVRTIAELATFIILENEEKAGNATFRAFSLCLTTKSYPSRKLVQELIACLLSSKQGFQVTCDLITSLREYCADISDKIKREVVKAICLQTASVFKDDELEELALQLIPYAVNYGPNYWLTAVQIMGLRPERVISKHFNSKLKKYLETEARGSVRGPILELLTFVHGEVVVENIIKLFHTIILQLDLKKVTREHYFIFHTPEGQLYDNSVLETSESDAIKNLKRESKVYSYKDQLEEIKLKKELEERRRKEGKEPKLSQKQKEAVKLQLEKEAAIRNDMKALNEKLENAFLLLNSAKNGNIGALGFCLKEIMGSLIDLFWNPLSAPLAAQFYSELGSAIFFFNQNCGEVVSQVSLKLFKPQCDLKKEWEDIQLESALLLMLKHLQQTITQDNFNASTFSYCYPTLEKVIRSTLKSQNLKELVFDIILTFLKKRTEGVEYSLEFIPRIDLCKLCYHIIGTSEHRLQQNGVLTLIELAKSCGDPLGPDPDSDELEIHINGMKSHLNVVRDTALRCILHGYPDMERLSTRDEEKIKGIVFQACYDPSSEIEAMAKKIWDKMEFEQDISLSKVLINGIVHPCREVRTSASKALGKLMINYPEEINPVVDEIREHYDSYLIMTPPVFDDFGRIVEEGVDNWEGRHGVGLAIKELAPVFSVELAEDTMTWILSKTFLDTNSTVHNIMVDAALEIIQLHGKTCINHFANLIESHLDRSSDASNLDRVRQSCVVLMGCLARHINPTDPRVKSIFNTLVDTLSTPSERVQEAVANCFPALIPAVGTEASTVVESLVTKLMEAEKYGERRGAAYGLAGMIKGLGILSLKQFDIMNRLAEGMQDKKNNKRREGSLMALELLCEFLGRLFEPYIVHVLPYLLQCLGDGNQYVREATEQTAATVMSRLSAHGVKLVLPALIAALGEDSWRTKCGSVDLLGKMAYCAPKQLSGCLPMIVPRLIEVLGDSHVKVQDSAAKALSIIGSVIKNPEIQSVVPNLLGALQDPAKKTAACLQVLLKTEFVHVVDSPSLALIMPVVERAFQDRSTENRRMACQIIGNMYSLTDSSDLAPYMKNVMPGIKASLVDPVPEVRAVAAKALGSMTRGIGEKSYDDLLPWLMKTLVSESNSVDRSGAAQGLAEVIGALGVEKLQRFMPEIIKKADSDDLPPYVRDGYMMMFIYMPSVFENDFLPYIGQILNPILKALADENEYVRETALRAGQRIVNGYADTAIALLLPELRKGIFDDNWRIRYSSVQLLGDLLYKISGVSGKMSTESASEDDNFGTENSQKLIIEKLGHERRNQILAGLYMGRSDVALMVRQSALHVWKVIVANTPKTLREILPTIFGLILNFLSSASHDKRQVAARTLGDLVRKLGEKILPEIIPILENGLESPNPSERQGVCIGLSEIMASTSREMVLAFVENLVPTLRRALCDPILGVRVAAAQTFGSLHSTVGTRALDEILPFMMKKLNDPIEGEYALDGLGQVLQIKSKAVMPYLIPQLIAPPPNTKALAILASVAGEALSKQLPKIFPVLITRLKEVQENPETASEEIENCENVLLAVQDELGVRLVLEELLDCCKNQSKGNRRPAILLLSAFVAKTKACLKPHIGNLIRALILLMVDTDEIVINATAEAIPAVLKHVGREEQIDHVEDIRQALRFARSDLKSKTELPGLSSPKSVKALLGIFREAILNAPADMKEQATNGMGELILLASTEAIKPSVIHVTGPLIRILGDRYNPDVKIAVLDTLTLLLPKVGVSLRAFLPQLQTTFQKAVNDENRNVRTKAEYALTQLVHVQGIKN